MHAMEITDSRGATWYLGREEALEYAGISNPTLVKYARSGAVAKAHIGTRVIYKLEDLFWLRQRLGKEEIEVAV